MKRWFPTILVMLPFASVLFAADPMAGTWKLIPSKTQSDNPPQMILKAEGAGISIQNNAGKPVTVNYDGKDYSNNVGNTIGVSKPSDHTLVIVRKGGGAVRSKSTYTVSSDGRHLTEIAEINAPTGPIHETDVWDRVGTAPGGDAFLGTWQADLKNRKSDRPETWTIKADSDQLDLTTSVHIFTAKLDDQDHKRDDQNSSVRLKRIDANTIEMVLSGPNPPLTRRWEVKGNTLIDTATGNRADGKLYKTVQYFERQK